MDKTYLVRDRKQDKWKSVKASDGYEAIGIILEAEPDRIDKKGNGWMDNLPWGQVKIPKKQIY